MKLVLVEWIDSGGFTKWTSFKDMTSTGVKRIRSVGWLLKESEESLWVVPHRDDADPEFVPMGQGELCIPRGAVTSIKEIDGGTEPAVDAAPALSWESDDQLARMIWKYRGLEGEPNDGYVVLAGLIRRGPQP